MVEIALSQFGIREIPGIKSHPAIIGYARNLGLEKIYTNDDISWCALFMSWVAKSAGKVLPSTNGDPYNMLRAKWFLNFGDSVSYEDACFGDVVVLQRPGGGHVGLLIAKGPGRVHLLGGNQGNMVNIAEMEKSRIVGIRRQYLIGMPESAKDYYINQTGDLSTNEA